MVGFYDWAGGSDEMKNTGISNPEQTNLLDFMRRTMKLAISDVMMWWCKPSLNFCRQTE